jgi:hypothetical protein
LCATNLRSGTSELRGRAQVRSYKGSRWPVDGGSMLPLSSLWERPPCAANLRSGTPQRGRRAQGALPQTSQAPGAAPSAPSVTHSRCAARPRFKSSAILARCAALGSIPCVPSEVVPQQRASSVRAYPSTMLRALSGHSLWVTFDAKLVPRDLLGQQEKSDSVGGSRSKRPPRRRHPCGNATTRNRGSGSRPAPGRRRRRNVPASTRPSPQPSPRRGEGAKLEQG